MTLRLYERTDVTHSSVQEVFRRTTMSKAYEFPLGVSIRQVYEDVGGNFLLLGEPGAGKTMWLLTLANELLAGEDEYPLPVMLNLSSWVRKKLPLDQWVIEQLQQIYQVPNRISRALLDTHQLLLLLDGLDEVKASVRLECIETINAYRENHLGPVVVCSRLQEYVTQPRLLALPSTLVLESLTQKQVLAYLKEVGKSTAALRVLLRTNAVVQEMATTPLMLNILMLAYQGIATKDLPHRGTLQEQQQEIFAQYVQRMLEGVRGYRAYGPDQMLRWLCCLAKKMSTRNQSVFLMEEMQPDWLEMRWQRLLYRLLFFGFFCNGILGATTGFLYGLITGLLTGLSFGIQSGCYFGVLTGLSFGILFGFLSREEIEIRPTEILMWSWGKMWQRVRKMEVLFVIVCSGLFVGVMTGLIAVGLFGDGRFGFNVGCLIGFLALLNNIAINGLRAGFEEGKLRDRTYLKPNHGIWKSMMNSVRLFLLSAGCVGFYSMLVAILATDMVRTWPLWHVATLLGALPAAALTGLLFGSLLGLLIGVYDRWGGSFFSSSIRPQYHLFSIELLLGLIIGMLSTFIMELALGMAYGIASEVLVWLMSFLLGGPICGVLLGLVNGGLTCIKHVCLRWVLCLSNDTPWNYSRFLEDATDHILLRRVGGGYSFIHPLFLDYFAALDVRASFRVVPESRNNE
ncbi:hypothetical protein KSF_109660 [Reticulibacter mediterranei]|uniref:NACHT domain-containing protein n=1 Tax=Reticulibacter mediterranei TaxID=2778369 RepID=A0A8J3IYM9_9CHLR|nr:NACHT domain-containing protein [Reticulibacter mediterranei]GHP00919.1 hypothetical protein KSF_109660 [Reticulibacter mediterranei]